MGNATTRKPTRFGHYVRMKRIENGERAKDMAARLGVSLSYLSAVELGRRSIPPDWTEQLVVAYGLSQGEHQRLREAVEVSSRGRSVDVTLLPMDDTRRIQAVVEQLVSGTEEERELLRYGIDHALSGQEVKGKAPENNLR